MAGVLNVLQVVRILEGRFGRLVLGEAAGALAAQTHAEHLVLVKRDGADGCFTVDGRQAPFTRSGLLFANAGQAVEFERPAAGAPTRLLACHLSGAWLTQAFPALLANADGAPFPQPHQSISLRIRRLADALLAEIVNDRFLSAGRLEFMLQELMLSIVDTYLARRGAASGLWIGSRYADQRIRKAIALLRARPNKEQNMDRLASRVGLSRSRFYDLFHACTGLSPRAYLDLLCVETAIVRLSGGHTKIGDLSDELGFSAQSNFTRFFLNQVGISPSEYRRVNARAEVSSRGPDRATGNGETG